MELQCEHCSKKFPSNASLYKHKRIAHHKQSLILVSHSHDNMNQVSKKRPPTDDSNKRPDKEPRIDPQLDDELILIDEYNDPGSNNIIDINYPKPRPGNYQPSKGKAKTNSSSSKENKQIRDNAGDTSKPDGIRDVSSDPELDDGLTIIDEYEDPGINFLDNDRRQVPIEKPVQVIDKTDSQTDSGYTVVENTRDYKQEYEKCVESHKKLALKYKKDIGYLKNSRRAALQQLRQELEDNCRRKMKELIQSHKRNLLALEDKLEDQYGEKIRDLKANHEKEIDQMKFSHKKELSDYEKMCQEKIKALNEQIENMEEDDINSSTLSKAIFNCSSMEEIFQIQRLIANYQFDEIIKNHLPTLQNLFLSLSYGILPICQPQREQVTDDQRRLVEQVQMASKPTAKRLLTEKRADVVNLFTIIKDSLKLARDTYNRYGTTP